MIVYLDVADLLAMNEAETGRPGEVRDLGLLDAAAHRPEASAFGVDAYPDLFSKAAALLHSLVRNHPFVDGNKRTGWLATTVFCRLNGFILTGSDDEVFDFVMAVATGDLEDVVKIAERLRSFAGQ